jgi:O-antigen chain-terminating bifunctional methyltransferase/kinase
MQLNDLLSKITDPYQPLYQSDVPWAPIYDASEISYTPLRAEASRQRLLAILGRLGDVKEKLGRGHLRILDLGCAQGYFSLSLCNSFTNSVLGVDHDPANIALCNHLAERRFGDLLERQEKFTVRFECAKVEDVMGRIRPGEFDVVLALSVFQHVCHDIGWEAVRDKLTALAKKAPVLFVELAQPGEPKYWARALPPIDRDILAGYSSITELGRYQSHFNETMRPMYLAIA